jgi:hypothetical protein
MTYIRTARPRDIALVGERMRKRDVEEVLAASGHDPYEALRLSLEASAVCWTVCDSEGVPFAMFGATPISGTFGSPWLLATDDFRANIKFVLRHTPAYIQAMHRLFPVLVNYVDCRNADSIRYLRSVGFVFTAFEPEHGLARVPFLQFTRVNHV